MITNWYDANRIEMKMLDHQGNGSAHWIINIDRENNDVIIEKDEYYDGKEVKGTIMIISGRLMRRDWTSRKDMKLMPLTSLV